MSQRVSLAFFAETEALPSYGGPPAVLHGQVMKVLVGTDYVAIQQETPSGATFQPAQRYEQVLPVDAWVIDHTFDHLPDVYVIDSGGSLVIGEVTYPSLTQVRIEFSAPFGGVAYLH